MCADISQAAKFPLGNLYITPGAQEAIEAADQTFFTFVNRHQSGDWGDVPPEDAKENEFSVGKDLRILSSYQTNRNERLWVITEADRSATTVLLPSEY